eukprot:CAMPEP_0179141580 /NCGR_PEP_ID=MMETSP0796-20121207/67919_1 /TAXON_ID=73915 /ORGANISM="Pyrodinium bahamense, Strain pbaha01" /LENGTH=293 /DNA_ID=CAMNT_0020841327 /DNA_START=84 /DNA_END=962 /DNA_ORIENTATION=+
MIVSSDAQANDITGQVLEACDDGTDLIELLPPEYTRTLSVIAFQAVTVPKVLGSELLKLLGSRLPFGPDFLHLKRVRTSPSVAGSLEVLICPSGTEPPSEVVQFLSAMECGHCHSVEVSRHPPFTRTQLAQFSIHWPLTYRRPSFEPLELSAAARAVYERFLQRAEEVRNARCGCVIIDRAGREIAAAGDSTATHPLRHAVMVAIEQACTLRSSGGEGTGAAAKRSRSEEEYLCQDCEVVTTHEPCIMCTMALVHSRVRLVAYRTPDPEFGGLGGRISLHTCEALNHGFRVLR